MIFKCSKNNDLYNSSNPKEYKALRFDNAKQALDAATVGDSVLILADSYPVCDNQITLSDINKIKEKKLRAYIEYPASLPGLDLKSPRQAEYERMVVCSDFFQPKLRENDILDAHKCYFVPMSSGKTLVSLAKVAGYDYAEYGLPKEQYPALFKMENQNILLGATAFSHFIKSRFSPFSSWESFWNAILAWLSGRENAVKIKTTPSVFPSYTRDEKLDANAEKKAFERSVSWFRNHALYNVAWRKDLGVIEGFESEIEYDGRQLPRTWKRSDCIAEGAMVFAYDSVINKNPASSVIATKLLDTIYNHKEMYQDKESSPTHGLVNWFPNGQLYFGDDNARVILATLMTSNLLNNPRWDERVLKCIYANFRTSGPKGFRHKVIDIGKFAKHGNHWKGFGNEDHENLQPHFQAYLWACYLWAYKLTGFSGFYKKAVSGIAITMEKQDSWEWTNGLTQEYSRMLLPLAFLCRIDNSQTHREWLYNIVDFLDERIVDCGCIQEFMGPYENGMYPPPASNDDYGKGEASLFHKNGDPVCDLLYTMNFAFLGFHEAAVATGDERIKAIEDKIADFLCRIQMSSEKHPFLDGAWSRCFDFKRWEYFASSSDACWGAYSVESGWTNTWVATVMAMRSKQESLFNLSPEKRFEKIASEIKEYMLNKDVSYAEWDVAKEPNLPMSEWSDMPR